MKLFVLGTLARAQQGAILVEFALVAPLFLGMLFGIVEFGRASWTLLALQQTATLGRDAWRYRNPPVRLM